MGMKIVLACEHCQNRNYTTDKNNNSKRMEIKKFCPICKKHTLHRETK
ncbi:50S ribosomal protein L33 [Saliterribacillus persicus]|nr:50S ribosomal protein L33 [Saliterribacillus persicus]